MSLRDIIDGAQAEAKSNGMLPNAGAGKADASDGANAATSDEKPQGFVRKSAANAKPAREAASSVRVVSGKSGTGKSGSSRADEANMTKEERKAANRRRREHEDFRSRGYELVLRDDPTYKATDRIWWILLILGFAMTVVSLVVAYVVPQGSDDVTTLAGRISLVTLVLAYVFIIGAFVYDIAKRRPLRKAAERKVSGMSDKRIAELIEADRRADAERRAARKAKKSSK